MDDPKKAAITILNMFDLGVVHLIEGTDINRPYNAITLSHAMHQFFGSTQAINSSSQPGASTQEFVSMPMSQMQFTLILGS